MQHSSMLPKKHRLPFGTVDLCSRRGFTLVELLVVIAVIGILIALLLPAVQSVREASRRMSCGNNLKQLGLAMQMHHEFKKELPPSALLYIYTYRRGEPVYEAGFSGWVALLPFHEEQQLYDHLDLIDSPQSDENRELLADYTPPVHLCPSMPTLELEPGSSSYAFSTGTEYYRNFENNGAIVDGLNAWSEFREDENGDPISMSLIQFRDITDGLSNTLFAGEFGVQEKVPDDEFPFADDTPTPLAALWANSYPYYSAGSTAGGYNDTRVSGSIFQEWEAFRSQHPDGAQFAFCDGSVKFIMESVDATVLDRLAQRNDGELIDPVPW